jgi:hypothetical protein
MVSVPYAPDVSCGGAPTGKPALNFTIGGATFNAELDSGASDAILKPATATAVKLTSFPKGRTQGVTFTGQAASTLQGYNVSVGIPGLGSFPTTVFTGPNIGCNVIPTQLFTSQYTITLSNTAAVFGTGISGSTAPMSTNILSLPACGLNIPALGKLPCLGLIILGGGLLLLTMIVMMTSQ